MQVRLSEHKDLEMKPKNLSQVMVPINGKVMNTQVEI